ncbi:protein STRUBBELIG-RECEPTOR FAMILY 3-like isoform X3 [Ananas comosus]|uniref:Protein STRUBBELIG-RECEPTOR FAMILY 3-like isoform X3 n=1 Tax=Ananas comosus TaxID=4615 RepID=A0A6P5GAB9_ANACO|nr:protein STRUBBELIG-RECEPTOR FAMILY 3-like isoform X3 [Ananas comosus]
MTGASLLRYFCLGYNYPCLLDRAHPVLVRLFFLEVKQLLFFFFFFVLLDGAKLGNAAGYLKDTGILHHRMLQTNNTRLRVCLWLAVCVAELFAIPFIPAYTDEQDVYAINNLYAALDSPPLPGWTTYGGDPCIEAWQGVQCTDSHVTAIDLSNNHIGGTVPENLPRTMRKFYLSANQLTGSIPSSLSELTLISDMSLSGNLLTGELPDAFQMLSGLVNLDISSNNLHGQLPSSMEKLSSLTTLHLQDNQLSGTLDVLENLPLNDLNIENNLFSGPIPMKMLNIPNFQKDGNLFNASVSPSPMAPQGSSQFSDVPAPQYMPASPTNIPSVQDDGLTYKTKNVLLMKLIGSVIGAMSSLTVAMLIAIFCTLKWKERKLQYTGFSKRPALHEGERPKEPLNTGLIKQNKEAEKVPEESAQNQREHKINMAGSKSLLVPPLVEKNIRGPIVLNGTSQRIPAKQNPPTTRSFSIAVLQQCTNNFSEENLISSGSLGQIYIAEFPEKKLFAVLKLDDFNSMIPAVDFLKLVESICELQHPNVVELVGYCTEFGQRLLVYRYFSRSTLYGLLHFDNDPSKKLSWNARLRVVLGAAKGLEYLHEGCQKQVVYRYFEPGNVLINDELAVRLSGCGLALVMSPESRTQLSGSSHAFSSYEAPELSQSGSWSEKSDIYSFGVVMLELLTGRKPYDSSRPREEQNLVRWANSQLHDMDALAYMMDPSIQGEFPVRSLSRFADIICRCIQHAPEFRPPMSQVVQDLALVVDDAMKTTDENPYAVRQETTGRPTLNYW